MVGCLGHVLASRVGDGSRHLRAPFAEHVLEAAFERERGCPASIGPQFGGVPPKDSDVDRSDTCRVDLHPNGNGGEADQETDDLVDSSIHSGTHVVHLAGPAGRSKKAIGPNNISNVTNVSPGAEVSDSNDRLGAATLGEGHLMSYAAHHERVGLSRPNVIERPGANHLKSAAVERLAGQDFSGHLGGTVG